MCNSVGFGPCYESTLNSENPYIAEEGHSAHYVCTDVLKEHFAQGFPHPSLLSQWPCVFTMANPQNLHKPEETVLMFKWFESGQVNIL